MHFAHKKDLTDTWEKYDGFLKYYEGKYEESSDEKYPPRIERYKGYIKKTRKRLSDSDIAYELLKKQRLYINGEFSEVNFSERHANQDLYESDPEYWKTSIANEKKAADLFKVILKVDQVAKDALRDGDDFLQLQP